METCKKAVRWVTLRCQTCLLTCSWIWRQGKPVEQDTKEGDLKRVEMILLSDLVQRLAARAPVQQAVFTGLCMCESM